MDKDEALKLALEALEWCEPDYYENPKGLKKWAAAMPILREALAQPAQERNFCPRCGKRTPDLTTIHTCTPPQEKNA